MIFCNTDSDPDPGKKYIFSKAITIFGEIFVFNQKSKYFIKQGICLWYHFKYKMKIMKNLLKKWILIDQFHLLDPDPYFKYGSGSGSSCRFE